MASSVSLELWDHYRHQLDHFGREESGFTVVSFDPRGYGASQLLHRNWNMDSLKTDAMDGHELMLTLGMSEFSVLGWCDGGTAGLHLAATFPQSVKKLVIFGTRSYVTDDELKFYESMKDVTKWEEGAREINTRIYGSYFQDVYSNWLSAINHAMVARNGDICTKELGAVACPTLIIHGAKDRMCPVFHGEYLRDHVTGSRLEVMEEGKHMLHWRHRDMFNRLVQDFLL